MWVQTSMSGLRRASCTQRADEKRVFLHSFITMTRFMIHSKVEDGIFLVESVSDETEAEEFCRDQMICMQSGSPWYGGSKASVFGPRSPYFLHRCFILCAHRIHFIEISACSCVIGYTSSWKSLFRGAVSVRSVACLNFFPSRPSKLYGFFLSQFCHFSSVLERCEYLNV